MGWIFPKTVKLLLLFILLGLFQSNAAHAQSSYKAQPETLPYVIMDPRHEPVFKQTKFLKLDPPKTLRERIERMTHGMNVDLPPEYDYYGHDIRRFMARICNPKVLASRRNVQGQIQNIQVAQKIANEWQRHHMQEAREIEALIEETNASSAVRSLYKTQKATADAFFVELTSWIKNNRGMMQYLVDAGDRAYTFQDGVFRFRNYEKFQKFKPLFEARERSLIIMQNYTPFRLMAY